MRSRHGYSGTVFFIGLAVLFASGWWWPGLLAIMALTAMVGAYERGKPLLTSGHIFLLGLAVAFALGGQFFLPIILVAIGLSQLPHFQRKRAQKREQKAKRKAEKTYRDRAPDIDIDEFLDSSTATADGEYENLDVLFDEENAARR